MPDTYTTQPDNNQMYIVSGNELTQVANAIRTKTGGSGNLTWPQGFKSGIQSISSSGGGGESTPSLAPLTSPATAGDILSGLEAYNDQGEKITGGLDLTNWVDTSTAGTNWIDTEDSNNSNWVDTSAANTNWVDTNSSNATNPISYTGTSSSDIISGKQAWMDGKLITGAYTPSSTSGLINPNDSTTWGNWRDTSKDGNGNSIASQSISASDIMSGKIVWANGTCYTGSLDTSGSGSGSGESSSSNGSNFVYIVLNAITDEFVGNDNVEAVITWSYNTNLNEYLNPQLYWGYGGGEYLPDTFGYINYNVDNSTHTLTISNSDENIGSIYTAKFQVNDNSTQVYYKCRDNNGVSYTNIISSFSCTSQNILNLLTLTLNNAL